MTRNRVSLAIGLAVALSAAYFAVKDIDAQALLIALASAQYGYVVPGLLVAYSGYLVRTWRWQLMIAPVKHISITTIFPLLVIGFAWNVLLPLRVGEVVRAHLLGQREGISRTMLLATIVAERVLDGVAIVALLALVGWLTPNLPNWVVDFTQAALILFGVALLGLVMLIVSEAFGGPSGTSALSSYKVSDSGSLKTISGSVPDAQKAACWVALTGNGKFAYTTNTASNSISSYTVHRNGSITLLHSIAATTDASPLDMAFSGNSTFLYVATSGGHTIEGFRVHADGSLTLIVTVNGIPIGANGLAAN